MTGHSVFAFPTGFDGKVRAACQEPGCAWVSRPGKRRTAERRALAHMNGPRNVVRREP